MLRGIRGAITVKRNSAEEILHKTTELLEAMTSANRVKPDRISMALFTVTPDLDAAFPAAAVRRLGWRFVPAMCMTEIGVPGALKRVIRVFLLAETSRKPAAIRHQYLEGAKALRPDLVRKT